MWVSVLCACLLLPAAYLAAEPETGGSSSSQVTSQQSALVQDYTRTLSKEWLKEIFDLDVDAIGFSMQRSLSSYSQLEAGSSPAGLNGTVPNGPFSQPAAYAFRLHLEQYDDLRNMAYDARDIPFAVKMDTDSILGSSGLDLQTSLFVPLSWKGELRAAASLPLPQLGPAFLSGLLDTAGFGSRWRLSNIYSNRLGISSVETGLDTLWLGTWNFGIDNKVRFGQGINENSQWLKVGKTF